MIDTVYRLGWTSLTREFSVKALESNSFEDEKVQSTKRILYVANMTELSFFTQWASSSSISVRLLPDFMSVKDFVKLEPGLLAIHPDEKFLVPGGRFNEIYGWDSFFIAKGLLASSRDDRDLQRLEHFNTAVSILKHLAYQIATFGKVHNANRSYFVNRSNPPFITSLILEIDSTVKDSTNLVFDEQVRGQAIAAAVREIDDFWLHPSKTDLRTGLTKYGNLAPLALCLAVEDGHYDSLFESISSSRGIAPKDIVDRLKRGDWPEDDFQVWKIVADDLALRESGHDTSERLVGCAASLCTADLNCLIFKSMSDLHMLTGDKKWLKLAERRRSLVHKYLYDSSLGFFCDYDCDLQVRRNFLSPAGVVYPLWSGIAECLHTRRKLRDTLVIYLEQRGGIVGSTLIDGLNGPRRQWDWPFGWAPHQMLAWEGLRRCGFDGDARRICYRWVSLLTKYYALYQCLPEKLDVVNEDWQLDRGDNVEYGTQCNDAGQFFGWTCASLAVAHGSQFISSDDTILLNTPIGDSIEQQLNILDTIMKHSVYAGSEEMTWSTMASARASAHTTPTDELFS